MPSRIQTGSEKKRRTGAVSSFKALLAVALAAELLAACSGGDDEADLAPTFGYLTIGGEDATVTLSDGEREVSYALPADVQPLSSLSCNSDGQLAIAVGRGNTLISPLILSEGELAPARGLPPALEPTWIDDSRLLVRIVDPEAGAGPRVYALEDGRFSAVTPIMPGQNPGWVSGREMIAVQAGPGGGFDRLGIYGLELESALEGQVDAAEWELLSSVPIEPARLDPEGSTFVFATAAQENQQRDIQAIESDGSDARTVVATPFEEYAPTWIGAGEIIFLRRELLSPGQDESEAEVDVVRLDLDSGDESVLAHAPGIVALASCAPGS